MKITKDDRINIELGTAKAIVVNEDGQTQHVLINTKFADKWSAIKKHEIDDLVAVLLKAKESYV